MELTKSIKEEEYVLGYVHGHNTGLINGITVGLEVGGGSDDNWVYPADWIPIPEPSANESYILFSNFHSAGKCNLRWEKSGEFLSSVIIDWGDGNVDTKIGWYEAAYHTYVVGTGTITDNGSEQWLIKVTIMPDRGWLDPTISEEKVLAVKFGSAVLCTDYMRSSPIFMYFKTLNASQPLYNAMFVGNYGLKRIELATPPVDIPNEFCNICYALEYLDLSTVQTIGTNSFYDCGRLIKGKMTFSQLVSIGGNGFFSGYGELIEINAPLLTTIGGTAFSGQNRLRVVTTPLLISVGANAFQNNFNLTSITYAEDCEFGANAFQNCYNLYPIPT